MSNEVATDGKTRWPYPRRGRCDTFAFFILPFIGLCMIVVGVTSSDNVLLIVFIILGIWAVIYPIYKAGSEEIVFDDHTSTIYVENKRCCSQRSSTKELGPYSGFSECVLKTTKRRRGGKGGGTTTYHSLDFIFADGTKTVGAHGEGAKEQKGKLAQNINTWWALKTNTAQQAIQPLPVQVVVQQAPPHSSTQGQTVYVQQPMNGQPVYPQTMPQGQGQMVCVHQNGQPMVQQMPPQGHGVYVQQPVYQQAPPQGHGQMMYVQQQMGGQPVQVVEGGHPPPTYSTQ